MRDNEEINERFAKNTSLYSLICEFLCREGYRTLRPADYTKILSEIERGNEVAIETLIEATIANNSVHIRWELPDGALRSFITGYRGGKAIFLSRNKVLPRLVAADIISLIVSQPPAFR